MLGDYLRAFWRGVLHNKVATLINVGGLALGLAVFFALSFYVKREFSWDAHWEDADRIYVASGVLESAGGTTAMPFSNAPWVLGDSFQSRHPDAFELYARIFSIFNTVVVDDEEYPSINRYHAEPAFFDLLQFDMLEGSLQEVLADPRSLAIHSRSAERMFGKTSPLGRTITFKSQQGLGSTQGDPVDFVIKAVYTLPEPSTFAGMQFIGVLDTGALPTPNARLDMWQMVPRPSQPPPQPNQSPPPPPEQPFGVAHYFKVREGVDAKALEADLRSFMDENRHMDYGINKTRYVFRNVQDLHLQPSLFEPGDNVQRLWIYAAIGVLVLLISGCNFVMLATLRLVDRMREVGIRKSVGGGVGQLLRQYLLDAFFHTLLAASLAVVFLGFAFPKLQVMLELPLQLDLLTARNLGLCLLMVVVFTLVSSGYSAWMTSQVKPGPLLRNGSGAIVGSGQGLRKLLVGIQFAIVVVLLLATAVVRQQIEYTRNRDPGYSLENVVTVRNPGVNLFARMPAVAAEFRKVPGVETVGLGALGPGSTIISPPNLVKAFAADGSVREAGLQQLTAGADYFRVLSVRVLAGREFSDALDAPPAAAPGVVNTPPANGQPRPTPPERKVVLNESAARLLGFTTPEQAVEQLLENETTTPDRQVLKQPLRVIGVVADTQFSSVMMPPVPQFYGYSPSNSFLAVKLVPGTDVTAATDGLRAVWDSVIPGNEFITQDNTTLAQFQLRREEFEARIISGSTALAIFIALLGLYGLVAATVTKRVKEIGVRKVMGAERATIVRLFLWQFSKPIVVANLLAWPFGYWAMTQWLQRFPYQVDLWVIVMSGLVASLLALLIAWLTVGVMAAKAASVKPVLALRYE